MLAASPHIRWFCARTRIECAAGFRVWPWLASANKMNKKHTKVDEVSGRRPPAARIEELQPGPALDALIAERVMGWKDVERQGSRSWGKKKDRAGRWRRAAVPQFCNEPTTAYDIDERMKELGLAEKYSKELAKMTHVKNLPAEWATPEQRCRAALKTMKNKTAKS